MCRAGGTDSGGSICHCRRGSGAEPPAQEGASSFHVCLGLIICSVEGWSCCRFSRSRCCPEHAVQCCSAQGDQSPRLETQKASQKPKLPFSIKAGSEQAHTLGRLCLLLWHCSVGAKGVLWPGQGRLLLHHLHSSVQWPSQCPCLSPLSQHWQMGCSPTPPQSEVQLSHLRIWQLAFMMSKATVMSCCLCGPSHYFPKRLPKQCIWGIQPCPVLTPSPSSVSN